MFKHIIRLIGLLLISVSLFSLFIGCQQSVKNTNATSNFIAKDKSPEKITIYFQGTENRNTKDVLSEVQKQVGQTLNIELDFRWSGYYQEYYNNIKTLLATGDTFDAFFSGSAVGVVQDKMIPEDCVMDLSNLLPENAPNLYKQYDKEELSAATYNGKLVGIPSHMQYSRRLCAFVREDFLKKYSIPEIKTIDDYEAYLKAVSENEKGVRPASGFGGFYSDYGTLDYTINLAPVYGYVNLNNFMVYKIDDNKIKVIPWEQTTEYKSAFAILKRWHEKGYLTNSVTGNYIYRELSTLTVASCLGEESCIDDLRKGDTIGWSKMFKLFPLYEDSSAEKMYTTDAIMINSNSKNADKVLKFIDWVQSNQDNYDLFMYGIKGKNYTLDNGKINNPDPKLRYQNWEGSEAFINMNYIRPASYDRFSKDNYSKDILTNTKFAPGAGFMPNSELVSNFAAVKEMVQKREESYKNTEKDMLSGESNVTPDQFIDDQKKCGTDVIVKELQKQLDSWAGK